MTHAVNQHLHPDRVLVVDMSAHNTFRQSFDAYPGAMIVPYGALDARTFRPWMGGLDVVYSAETFYWEHLPELAREMGVRTILHVMPELNPYARDPDLPKPDLFLNPTSYLHDALPEPKMILPVPVDRERLKFRHRTHADTFLHMGGHKALADRNGTRVVLSAIPFIRQFCRLIIRTQDTLEWRIPSSKFVQVEVVKDDYPDHSLPFDEADVLVLPRRYAGLCLPAQEAMSSGLAVLMTDCVPNRDWLHVAGRIPGIRDIPHQMKGGRIPVRHADPRALAQMMDRLIEDHELVARMSLHSDEYAESISWTTMAGRYREVLSEEW